MVFTHPHINSLFPSFINNLHLHVYLGNRTRDHRGGVGGVGVGGGGGTSD